MLRAIAIVVLGVSATSALPQDPIIRKLESGLRYQYIQDADGAPQLADLWGSASDLAEAARYNPAVDNVYNLFTRKNPNVSQPMLLDNKDLLANTNFDPKKKTVILIHGWRNDLTGILGSSMIPALLAGGDVNVIGVDWFVGANPINYFVAVANTLTSGVSVAQFITWLNAQTGAELSDYYFIGHSLGGHQVGIVGRNLGGAVPYILSIDPALPGWLTNSNRFKSSDGVYTEVIHSNSGMMGYLTPLGDVDFYPNGGVDMPGCLTPMCSHDKPVYYIAESVISGGFTGRKCSSVIAATGGNCNLPETLEMGGWAPKTGLSGIYRLDTNAISPYSLD